MKKPFVFCMIVIALIISCNNETENLNRIIKKGEFSKAIKVIEFKLQHKDNLSTKEIEKYLLVLNSIQAIKREYSLLYYTVYKELKVEIPDLTEGDMLNWENDNSLEYYLIDGVKKYYNNCVFDLFQLNKDAASRAKIPEKKGSDATKYPLETIRSFENDSVLSKKINVGFSFFENIGSIPDQTLLRACIPYVRENRFQSNLTLVYSNISNIAFPESDNLTSMIYFEKIIDKKNNSNKTWRSFFKKPSQNWIKPLRNIESLNDSTFICQFIYKFDSKGYYKKINPSEIKPYNTADAEYKKYTSETVNNSFTPYLKNLSDEIVGKETNDYLKAKKIYKWICENLIWTNSKTVIGDKAEYSAKFKRGDCGEKANLFISLCRINGIPAKVQGGWRVEPNRAHSQHSWAQVYFEPLGWLPVDADAGSHLINNENESIRFFYFCNRTPYRMIIYDDESELQPEKLFECIYGGGSQLGAFQWREGDIEPNIKIDSYVE